MNRPNSINPRKRFAFGIPGLKAYFGLKNNKNGFSLLEVMISLAITGGLLITLIYTLNYHLGIAERQKTITDCTSLAKQKLHELENLPSTGKGHFETPYSNYSYETTVLTSSFPSMVEIRVTVSKDKENVVLSKLIPKTRWL